MNTDRDYIEKIKELKKNKNAVILAHYYQTPDIQDLADFIGNQIKLKFVLVSDGQTNFDGFYFDDVNIETYTLNNSIENINLNQDVNVFPNPANSNLSIEYNHLEKNKEFQVSIINAFGQTIFTETVDNNTKSTKVDVSKWAKGVYLILLKSGDAKIITKKVTII